MTVGFIKSRNDWTMGLSNTIYLNPFNAELNPICHLLELLGAHPILHVSRIRVNVLDNTLKMQLRFCG
jgi:hypothetical protein